MESPLKYVKFPYLRREVLVALAELCVAREILVGEDRETFNNGSMELIWDALVEDYRIADANSNVGYLYFGGLETELLKKTGTLLEGLFSKYQFAGEPRANWVKASKDQKWLDLEQLALRSVAEMVRNWGFPEPSDSKFREVE